MSACVGPLSVPKVAFGAIAAWIEQELRRERQTAPERTPNEDSAPAQPLASYLASPLSARPPLDHGCRVGPWGLPCRPSPLAAG